MSGISVLKGKGYHRALFSSLRTASATETKRLLALRIQEKPFSLFSQLRSKEYCKLPSTHTRHGYGCQGVGSRQTTCTSVSPSHYLGCAYVSKVPFWTSSSTTHIYSVNKNISCSSYVSGEVVTESIVTESGAMVKRKLYAVKRGRTPGLYNTWKEAEEQVKGYSHAIHRSFTSRREAEIYLGRAPPTISSAYSENTIVPTPTPVALAPKEKKEPKDVVIDLTEDDGKEDIQACSSSSEAEDSRLDAQAEGISKEKVSLGEEKEKNSETGMPGSSRKPIKVRQSSERIGEYHIMQFDGGARGNPGIAGAGVVLLSPDGTVLHKKSVYLGDDITNNQAEYEALIMGLQLGLDLGYKKLEVEGDSELIINQVTGNYKVRSSQLAVLLKRVVGVLDEMEDIIIRHIPRNQNKIADELANEAMNLHESIRGHE